MRLFPELVQDFEGFDETPEDATKEVVHLMNELNFISTDSVDELIAPYAVPMLNEDLMDIQEGNKDTT